MRRDTNHRKPPLGSGFLLFLGTSVDLHCVQPAPPGVAVGSFETIPPQLVNKRGDQPHRHEQQQDAGENEGVGDYIGDQLGEHTLDAWGGWVGGRYYAGK